MLGGMSDIDKVIELAQELGRAREKVEYLEGYVRALQNKTTESREQPSTQEEPPKWPAVYSGHGKDGDHLYWASGGERWEPSDCLFSGDVIAPPGFKGLKDLSVYKVLRVVTDEDVKSWKQDGGEQ